MATAASAVGNDHAQSPSSMTAAVPTTQPKKKPNRRWSDLLKRPASTGSRGWRLDNKSISDNTVLVKLPVITAVVKASSTSMPRYLTVLSILVVAKQKLDSPEIAGGPVTQGSLRASERMRSEKSWIQPNVSIGVENCTPNDSRRGKIPRVHTRGATT